MKEMGAGIKGEVKPNTDKLRVDLPGFGNTLWRSKETRMRFISGIWSVLPLAGMLLLCASCAEKTVVSYYLISPPAGTPEISEADRDTLCATLDAVAARCKMAKFKASQPGIIRYYQPNSEYAIGFYAKREKNCLKVFALPMMPAVAHQDSYVNFRQYLADVLSQTFPGRVRMVKP